MTEAEPSRKTARSRLPAVGALTALAAYLIVSGSSVPALRAFVMACVAFGAILLDRPAISMRGLALAAFIVVLIFPESVIEPGFQMSFAATMALVALFERHGVDKMERQLRTGSLVSMLYKLIQTAVIQGVKGITDAGLDVGHLAVQFVRFADHNQKAVQRM